MAAERPEPGWLRAIEAGDPHISPNDRHGGSGERPDVEKARSFQILDRDLDIPPSGLLHEERADDRFEGRLCGPPVLRSVVGEQALIHGDGPMHRAKEGRSLHEPSESGDVRDRTNRFIDARGHCI